ncbi:MAG: GerMN domain-containing protein [Candidatus Choladocola sp.]|nr:GerMN domain-containing protein [Candidatus Choladocola sp.]
MKIKKHLFLLVLAAAILLCSCGSKQTEEKGYTVYYVNAEGTRLMESTYTPAAETFDEMMEELLNQLAQAPAGYVSALPESVKVNGYERGIDALRIDFSKEYYDLSNTTEVLLRAAVVKTFCQIPGVMKVMITVEKEQLKDAEGEPVPPMDAVSFIDTKEGGINSYLYATLCLYYSGSSGSRLVKEMRNLHYSSNMVLERVVVEQLIEGPENTQLRAVLDKNVRILNIYSQDGVCTINFNEDFNTAPSDNPPDPEVCLYAIVNSICETCDNIEGVKFEIDGESDVKFRGKVDLGQVFTPNTAYVETEEMQTEGDTEETEPITEKSIQSESQPESEIQGNPIVGVDPSLTEE